MKTFELGLDELEVLAKEIENTLPKGGVVILEGDLASGKTTLTQAFASYLGEEEIVTSPTFSLQQCYGKNLYHYDLYNKGLDNFLSLGLLEELEKEGYHLIEWADESLGNFLKSAGISVLHIKIKKQEKRRTYLCIH
ncbi:tRNA (adenosine(37)-N6)-threonylcarbamoyltransferase complex ATPase subunit type 1 TsaE [Sulfurimonas sp. MAG313]|nr:tRNA (adenosine(37)-N6)-threonylcarbamoyltransferase complex ATPase subunit type 1 TsaE [Sulfurimonas sp. MAG313]MDF1880096.1 tRNA (adenosine(37)-N6)-threonylcarbamoyltransferase complex ATPase subunit type 1 TsaE [Sulfurimonas sp. MAG313]